LSIHVTQHADTSTDRRPRRIGRRARRLSAVLGTLAVVLATYSSPSDPVAAAAVAYRPSYTTLRFSDGFTAQALDPKWAVYNSRWSREPQARVPSLVNAAGGALHVRSAGRSGSGLCLCRAGGSPSLPYGRWEVRARMSANADHGFAILLWPNAENWPTGGEIDLAETPGNRRKVQFTVHYGATNKQRVYFFPGNFTTWHTFALDWTPTAIRYAVDGKVLVTITDRAMFPRGPMHLALQAGADSRRPTDTTASLDVDWIRYYR
jgi:hypothetical protein